MSPRLHSPEIRFAVLVRDRGICQLCGLDTIGLWLALSWVKQQCEAYWRGRICDPLEFASFKQAVGPAGRRYPQSLWDVDMITPWSRGGTEELGNLRTLCIPCHRRETKRVIYGR